MHFSNTHVSNQRFNLGKVVITRGALSHCEDHSVDYFELIMRHASGDFGTVGNIDNAELTEEERSLGALATDDGLKLNLCAIADEQGMIMSVYPSLSDQDTKIWIQTLLAKEETYTTILLPSEY